jgi:SpoVK/Ycf46/Vps4 family AAA+-type ATPase
LRKGRFDEIFFIDLPTPEERYNIFKIHLSKFHQNSIKNLDELVEKTKGFNGAEIEETVKEAMFISYVENPNCRQIEERHLLESASQVVPLAQTMCNEIKQLRAKAKDRKARLASLKANEESIDIEEPTTSLLLKKGSDIDNDNDIFNQNI